MPGKTYDKIPLVDRPRLEPADQHVLCGNGTPIHLRGRAKLNIKIQGVDYAFAFYISDDNIRGILGNDFLQEYNGALHIGQRKFSLNNRQINIYDAKGMQLNHRAIINSTVVIPAKSQGIIWLKIQGRGQRRLEDCPVMVEGTTQVFVQQGVAVGRSVATPRDGFVPVSVHNLNEEPQRLCRGTTVAIIHSIVDMELFDEDQPAFSTTHPGERVGERVDQQPREEATADDYYTTVNALFNEGEPSSDTTPESTSPDTNRTTTWSCDSVRQRFTELPADHLTGDRLPEHTRGIFERYAPALKDDWHKVYFNALLNDYSDVFARDKYDLGQATMVKHHIDTGDEPPVKQKPRRLPFEQHEEVENQVRKLAECGIIQPSNSRWASNLLLVKKKDNTWRMCIDYRELNRKTKNQDLYMIPRIDDTLDALGGAQLFCTLDLIQGYHQVRLTDECRHKTAFLAPHMTPNLWEYVCMPFGITGGPSTFQRLMDSLLRGLKYRTALAYLDDVIVFGKDPIEVMDRLAEVLERMRGANLKLKPSKCTFFEPETLFLGHIVSGDGVRCDPQKVEAVKNWRRPSSCKEALSFAAFVNYYHRFVPGFSEKARPLYELGHKKKFEWTDEHEEAFQALRTAVITAPVVGYPRDTGDWILDTDASAYAMGAVLSQKQKNADGVEEEKVIAYGSKAFHGREQRYCARRRELLAIAYFTNAFRPYLYGRYVTIRTDHASLKYIKTMKNPDDQAARWLERLEEYRYTIEIRAGSKHVNADALSRLTPCGVRKCICKGVDDLEHYELATTGRLEDNWRMAPTNLNNDAQTIRRDMEAECPESPSAVVNAMTVPECMYDTLTATTPHGGSTAVEVNSFAFAQRWSAADIAAAQAADPDMQLLYRSKVAGERPTTAEIEAEGEAAMSYFHDWGRITLSNQGILYRRWESNNGRLARQQMLLPHGYRELLFNHLHTAINAGHMGFARTSKKLQMKYFWHRMNEDVRAWIDVCPTCNQRKIINRHGRAPMQVSLVGERGQRVAIDLMGPFCKTHRGNQHIMVIIDHFTKYAMAIPLQQVKAEDIAEAFVTRWIPIFGAPRQVHTDRGHNVDGALMNELSRLLGAEKTRTSGYHPQGDGQVERQNRTILNMMHSYAADDPKNWDQHLSTVLIGYNSTRHTSTGFEPNRLAMGANLSMPIDLMMPVDPDVHVKPVNQYVHDLSVSLRYAYELARRNLKRAATVQKRYHDRRLNFKPYKVGDAVMVRVYRFEKGEKFRHQYEGPYYVLKVLGEATYRIATAPDARPKTMHYDSLRPCLSGGASEREKEWIYQWALQDKQRWDTARDTGNQATVETRDTTHDGTATQVAREFAEIERDSFSATIDRSRENVRSVVCRRGRPPERTTRREQLQEIHKNTSVRGTLRLSRSASEDELPVDNLQRVGDPFDSPDHSPERDSDGVTTPDKDDALKRPGRDTESSPPSATRTAEQSPTSPVPPPSDYESDTPPGSDRENESAPVATTQARYAIRPRRQLRRPLRFRDYTDKLERKRRRTQRRDRYTASLLKAAAAALACH